MLEETKGSPPMTDAAAVLPTGTIDETAPLRRRAARLDWLRFTTVILSLAVLAAALWQARGLRLGTVAGLIPVAPLFWLVFATRYLALPAFDWLIFRRLWEVTRGTFAALLRKLIYNELLLGYVGDAYFYTWARRRLPIAAKPFGAVKDVAILSAIAGNVMTLVLIAVAYPYLALLPLAEYTDAIVWSLAAICAIPLAAILFRQRVFSLTRRELWVVFGLHMLRILATTVLLAWTWHLALPEVKIGWWLVLSAIRLLVSRLPFVPNKDIVFAGIAVLALGQDVAISSLMAMMAVLILSTHLVLALFFGITDLVKGEKV